MAPSLYRPYNNVGLIRLRKSARLVSGKVFVISECSASACFIVLDKNAGVNQSANGTNAVLKASSRSYPSSANRSAKSNIVQEKKIDEVTPECYAERNNSEGGKNHAEKLFPNYEYATHPSHRSHALRAFAAIFKIAELNAIRDKTVKVREYPG